jgi:hypothetical protein
MYRTDRANLDEEDRECAVQESFDSLLEVVEQKEGELQNTHNQVHEVERNAESHVKALQRQLDEKTIGMMVPIGDHSQKT